MHTLMTLVAEQVWYQPLVEAASRQFIFSVVGAIAIVAIVFGSVRRIVTASAREKSRREIAAFIAEGSMTPEQGERLMRAKEPEDTCC